MTAFATTLHDPDGRFRTPAINRLNWIDEYLHATIVCTDQTDPRTIHCLESHPNVRIIINQTGQIGESRRRAIRAALDSGAESILYCDFDRWLHWAGTAPKELAALPQHIASISPLPWYICIGRTERAFASHPRVQQLTEAISNGVLSSLIRHNVDATAGCCWLSAQGAAFILEYSREKTNATDLEWPALVHRRSANCLGQIRVEGLEFETTEFYVDEIESSGGTSIWTNERYECPDAWINRLQLTLDSINAALRVFNLSNREPEIDRLRRRTPGSESHRRN